jgi:acyl-CoA hydrolase
LPNDGNGLGNLMGGRLLHWMDICASISSRRHAGMVCVTAGIDSVDFQSPIIEGEIVILNSHVNRAFRTSMEVEINVWAEETRTGGRRRANKAYFTFVALGEDHKPVPIPQLIPDSDTEKTRFADAGIRRDFRLLLSDRLPEGEAPRLQEYLDTRRHQDS